MNKLTFLIISLFTILLSLVFPFFLPERFYLDANLIITDPYNEKGLIGSYPLTMLFYWITYFGKLPFSLVALIQLPILFYLLQLIGIPKQFGNIGVKNLLIYLSFLMVGIYIGQPSKEFITFIFSVLIVFIITYKRFSLGVTILFSSMAFVVFGVLFRPYFVFMPIVAFPIYLITKIHFKNRWIMALCLGGLTILLLSFIYKLTSGDFFSEMTREELNRNRLLAGDSNADTMIVSPIPVTNLFSEAFSILYGFITVNFPINGLRFFYKPQVLAFIVWQILISGIVILRFGNLLSSYPKYKKELWLMSFLLAYFIIQGNFEPDLGSAVRHKIGILPIIYYLFYYDDFKRKD